VDDIRFVIYYSYTATHQFHPLSNTVTSAWNVSFKSYTGSYIPCADQLQENMYEFTHYSYNLHHYFTNVEIQICGADFAEH
jgi:hypothetical protein